MEQIVSGLQILGLAIAALGAYVSATAPPMVGVKDDEMSAVGNLDLDVATKKFRWGMRWVAVGFGVQIAAAALAIL
jgi:hypothetical protein